jgi:aryl-alcohol dehydrogenase-like predicted oxidoreductase
LNNANHDTAKKKLATAPIARATSISQLSKLLGAATLELDKDLITLLDQASAEA